jgi:hypothetical protein
VPTSIIFYPTSFTNYTTLGKQPVGIPVDFFERCKRRTRICKRIHADTKPSNPVAAKDANDAKGNDHHDSREAEF